VLGARSAVQPLVWLPIYGIYSAALSQPNPSPASRRVVDNDLRNSAAGVVETWTRAEHERRGSRPNTCEARTASDRGQAFVAVESPPNTERDVSKASTPHSRLRGCHLPVHIQIDARGVATAVGEVDFRLVRGAPRLRWKPCEGKLASLSPADVQLQPLSTRWAAMRATSVTAAFVMIAANPSRSVRDETGTALARRRRRLGRCVGAAYAHLTIYLPALALYLIVLRASTAFRRSATSTTVRARCGSF